MSISRSVLGSLAVRILVIEGERAMAESLEQGLQAEGFAVDVAGDGQEGLWLAGEVDYDAIILDLMLPEVNGFQVCRTLRDRNDWTPVLMLTANDGHLDEAEGLDTGADGYLTKPFAFVVLLASLRACKSNAVSAVSGSPCAFGLRVGCRRSHSVLDLSSSDHILPILRGASTL